MKILAKLTAESAEAAEPAPCVRQGHNLELAPGFFVNMSVCDDGLRIRTNQHTVFIPRAELISLAQTHHDGLRPPPPKPAPPARKK